MHLIACPALQPNANNFVVHACRLFSFTSIAFGVLFAGALPLAVAGFGAENGAMSLKCNTACMLS